MFEHILIPEQDTLNKSMENSQFFDLDASVASKSITLIWMHLLDSRTPILIDENVFCLESNDIDFDVWQRT